VQVCPTGIDIRQGLQMECIGCTACIDACDEVMDRIGRPKGLIRYDSQSGFARKPTRWIRPRTLLYFGLLLLGASVATWALSTLRPASFGITRLIGTPYVLDADSVRNQFFVRIVNKRNAPASFIVSVSGAPAGVRAVGLDAPVELGPLEEVVRPLILQQPVAGYAGPFRVRVELGDAQGRFDIAREVEFVGPDPGLLRGGALKR
jgi:polyferredoxin